VGFEPTASASRTQRSTKLSHSPKYLNTNYLRKMILVDRVGFYRFCNPILHLS
jgi:hypothetical protein